MVRLKLLLFVLLGLIGMAQGQGAVPSGCFANPSLRGEVRVAAAASLNFAMRELEAAFEAAHPEVKVSVQLGSSANFFTQLQQGLPVDLFFSANAEYPRLLEELGLAEPGTRRLYAVGRLALWVHNSLVAQGLDPRALGIDLLRDPRVTQLAIANPVHAPYGRAGVTLLEHYGLLKRTREVAWREMRMGIPGYFDFASLAQGKRSFDFVYGNNVAQAAQLAATATGVGLIAYSLALAEDLARLGEFWLAPIESHLRLEQEVIILTGQARPEVKAVYEFVFSPQGRDIWQRYGFSLPAGGSP